MGQYYIVANIDKKEYMRSDGGVKLMEWSYNKNYLVLNLMKKLATEWKGDRVFVVGDYALSRDRINEKKQAIEKDYDYDILEKIEKEIGIYNEKEEGYYKTVYSYAMDNFKEVKLKKLENEEYKFIYNHKREEFIELNHCPLAWLYKENGKYNEITIAPISLLLTLGNGMGGGDYFGNNDELVGKYINDVENLEITKEPLNVEYKEFRPEFYEFSYIPYTEIKNEIGLDEKRRITAERILEYITQYGKEQYNFDSISENKEDTIFRLAIAIEKNNIQIEKRILKNIIESYDDLKIKEQGKNLIKTIDNTIIESIARSCKFEMNAKLEKDIKVDNFINETYKKIIEKLKIDNIKNIQTLNGKTAIIFTSTEKLDIENKEKDNIDEYIENSKKIRDKSQVQENININTNKDKRALEEKKNNENEEEENL